MEQTNKQINNIRQERRSASETLKTAWDTKVSSAPINQHNGVGRALIDLCCELILLMPFVLFHFEMILYCVFNFEVTVGGGVLLECIKRFLLKQHNLILSLRLPQTSSSQRPPAAWSRLRETSSWAGRSREPVLDPACGTPWRIRLHFTWTDSIRWLRPRNCLMSWRRRNCR